VPLDLRVLPDRLAVCRLPAASLLPAWAVSGGLSSATWTADETSIVCAEAAVPAGVAADRGWRALAVVGPLDFGLTGILLSIAQPLAEAGVSIFAVSTYDTDYILVKADALPVAVAALSASGHRVIGDVG
jgi:hypothetical protein